MSVVSQVALQVVVLKNRNGCLRSNQEWQDRQHLRGRSESFGAEQPCVIGDFKLDTWKLNVTADWRFNLVNLPEPGTGDTAPHQTKS